jgi:hypothetical protein
MRARLPAYLARRRALLDQHTALIAPLWALVSSYEEPSTTQELWATRLGALPGDVESSWSLSIRMEPQPQVEAKQEGRRSCCRSFWPWSCD